MNKTLLTIVENKPLTPWVWRMILEGDTSAITAPGQFINMQLDGLYLRRPFSVCDCTEERVTIIYKVVGVGTRAMTQMQPGQTIDTLMGLGNGYNLELSGQRPILLGGGVGVPPLYLLAKKLIAQGKQVTAVLAFNTKDEIFYEDEFKALGATTIIATADGSYGERGFATDVIGNIDYTYFYTCGPEPMLKAVYRTATTSGQFSFEERMGCGFGACMGCTCETITGYKRICKDGPVLEKEEIKWND